MASLTKSQQGQSKLLFFSPPLNSSLHVICLYVFDRFDRFDFSTTDAYINNSWTLKKMHLLSGAKIPLFFFVSFHVTDTWFHSCIDKREGKLSPSWQFVPCEFKETPGTDARLRTRSVDIEKGQLSFKRHLNLRFRIEEAMFTSEVKEFYGNRDENFGMLWRRYVDAEE